jgi:hypothetical protein
MRINIDQSLNHLVTLSINQSLNHSLYCRKHSLQTVGIAGIREFSAVKCLHCHYAHHLARPDHGNLIGRWVEDLLKTQQQLADQQQQLEEEEEASPLSPPLPAPP